MVGYYALQHLENNLRTGCAAGIDGGNVEYVKWAKDTNMASVVCDMVLYQSHSAKNFLSRY